MILSDIIQLLPLRSSNLPVLEVKKVLLLGQKDYVEKEWKDLNDFQDVYFMEVYNFSIKYKNIL